MPFVSADILVPEVMAPEGGVRPLAPPLLMSENAHSQTLEGSVSDERG